jgi:hypothetical protein
MMFMYGSLIFFFQIQKAESTPEIYTALSGMASCAPLISKMKYFMGHKHCNIVTSPNVGFMVGAMGMSSTASCGGEFGIPVVDTTFGDFRVYYFSIAKVFAVHSSFIIIITLTPYGMVPLSGWVVR